MGAAPPLAGCRVLITRPRAQAAPLIELLQTMGAVPLTMPVIAIQAAGDLAALDQAIADLADFDWIVFTSVNGVRLFLERLQQLGRGPALPPSCQVAAIGPKTARALDAAGLVAHFVPDEHVAEAVLAGLVARGVAGKAVLLPRAAAAREVLPDQLQALGARVTVVPLYQTIQPADPGDAAMIDQLLAGQVDYVTFTSASTVTGFAAKLGPANLARLPATVRFAAIGPVTAGTALTTLGRVDVAAAAFTIEGLVQAIVADRAGLHPAD